MIVMTEELKSDYFRIEISLHYQREFQLQKLKSDYFRIEIEFLNSVTEA